MKNAILNNFRSYCILELLLTGNQSFYMRLMLRYNIYCVSKYKELISDEGQNLDGLLEILSLTLSLSLSLSL